MEGTTQPATPLRILMVEDSQADVELLLRELRALQRPVEHRRVDNRSALESALSEFAPDIVLSDYSMPAFGGHDALGIVLEHAPEIPFVFVSGTIGEERAIEALQRGAWDYVLKENLRRLPASIERALRMAAERAERTAMQRALRESEERFRSIVEGSQDWIWETSPERRLTYSNAAVHAILGYAPDELEGTDAFDLVHGDDRPDLEARLPQLVQQRRGWRHWRSRWRHRRGDWRMLESTGTPMFDEAGALTGYRGINHDATERLAQEARIHALARIQSVLAAIGTLVLRNASRDELLLNACRVAVEQGGFSAAGIGVIDAQGRLDVVRTYGDREVLLAVDPGEPMSLEEGSPWREHPSIRAFLERRVFAVPDYADCQDLPPALCHRMLRHGVQSQVTVPVGRQPWGLLALFSDEPREYDAEELDLLKRLADEIDHAVDFIAQGERLRFLAHHNPVSGLPNRIPFQHHVTRLLERGPVMVAALDLPRFDRITHSRGREFADALLAALGARLQRRQDRAFIAHPEAEAFLLACPAGDDIAAELERLRVWLAELESEAFTIRGERVHPALRAGVALGPAQGMDAETLERNALAALAEARELGVGLRGYSIELSRRLARRMELEHDLRRAIDERQFELYYQAKFDARTRALTGAEALLRWNHPDVGLVSPVEFIPVLEETGLLVPVGRWILGEALATAQAWRTRCPQLRIAVNVSARELRNADFLDGCRTLLAGFDGAAPIDIEVTESVVVDDIEQSVRLLQGLRELGCRVAIDDFGTGYSSLNYLVRLPVDTIKIDRSFVAMLGHSRETVTLVSNTIGLAHSLGLDVVAEGVEEEAQAKLLCELQCEQLQGYLLGRPKPKSAFEARFFG